MADQSNTDRSAAALAEGEARYRALTESAFELIALWRDDRLLAINPAGARLLGYTTPAEIVGEPLPIVPSAAGDLDGRLRALLDGAAVDLPMRQPCRRPDGSVCVIEFAAAIVPFAGEPAVQLVGRDVTPLEAADEMLRRALDESEQRYRSMVEGSPLGIVVHAAGRVVYANPAAVALVGAQSAEELLRRPVEEWFAADQWQAVRKRLERLVRGEPVEYPAVVNYRRIDGSEFPVETVGSVIRWHGAQAIQVLGHDITARVEAEQALRRSEEYHRALLDQAFDCLLVMDADTTIRWASPGAHELLGVAPGTLRGRRPEEFVDASQRDAARALRERALRTPGRAFGGVVRLVRDDGVVRYAETRSINLLDNQAVGALVTHFHDVTARHAAEQAVARFNHDLERRVELRTAELAAANRELEAFSYSVSHDLRAPLRHMTGFAAVLRDRLGEALDADARHCLERITAAADRMSMLIDGLLQLSRMTRTPLETRTLDLQQLVAEVQRDCAAKAPGAVWDIGALPALDADRTLVRVVLTNLLENACKFTAPRRPARIAIDAEAADGWVRVHVRDNGVGFDPSYADKLFSMFERLHPAREFEGDGIGLATVRRIVERHGGEVGAGGVVDAGATFWFTLPAAR